VTSKWNPNEPEFIDAEIVDDTPATQPEYRGAHRRADDYDGYGDGYDEYPEDAAAAVGPEVVDKRGGSTAVAAGGVPKRGLAMILIAVAALLLLWGIWAMMQNRDAGSGDATATTTAATVTSNVATTVPGQPGQPGQPGAEGVPSAPAPAGAGDPAGAPAGDPAGAGDPNAPAPAAPAPAPGEGLNPQTAQVYVYNNSGVPDLAGSTANSLKGQFNVVNDSPDPYTMNMPEQQYGIFPETYVFFDPQVAGAEQVAADLARRVGGTARAKNDIPQGAVGIPAEAANNRNSITVVLAG